MNSNSSSSKALKEEGNKEFTGGHFAKALGLYQAALEVCANPTEKAILHSNCSLALLSLKRPAEALAAAETAIASDPTWAKAYLRKASALHSLGRLTEAKVSAAEVLARETDPASSLFKSAQHLLTEIEAELSTRMKEQEEADTAPTSFLQKVLSELPDYEDLIRVARSQGAAPQLPTHAAPGAPVSGPHIQDEESGVTIEPMVEEASASTSSSAPSSTTPAARTASSHTATSPANVASMPPPPSPSSSSLPPPTTATAASAPASPPAPKVTLDTSAPEVRSTLQQRWEALLAQPATAPPSSTDIKTAFEGFRYPLRKDFVTGLVGCARLALRNRQLAASVSKSPFFSAVRIRTPERSACMIPAIVRELASTFAVPLVTVNDIILESVTQGAAGEEAGEEVPREVALEALLRVLADRPAIVYIQDRASCLEGGSSDTATAAAALLREAMASKTRPNLFVFGIGDTPRATAAAATAERAERVSRQPAVFDPATFTTTNLPKGAAFAIPVTLPADADIAKAQELFSSLNERFSERFQDVIEDDAELQRIQREDPTKLLPALMTHPKAASVLDALVKETVQTVNKAGVLKLDPVTAAAAAAAAAGPASDSLPWPPAGLVGTDSAIQLFLQQAKIPLRRIAQLADAEVACVTFPRFNFGKVDDERKYALENDIASMEKMGIAIREPVLRLWAGERNADALTKGLPPNVSMVVRALVLDLEAHQAYFVQSSTGKASRSETKGPALRPLKGRPLVLGASSPRKAIMGAPYAASAPSPATASAKTAMVPFSRQASFFPEEKEDLRATLEEVTTMAVEAPTEPGLLARWRKALQMDAEEENKRRSLAALDVVLARKGFALEEGAETATSATATAVSTTPAWLPLVSAKEISEEMWDFVLRDAVHYLVAQDGGEDFPVTPEGRTIVADKAIVYGLKERAGLSPETMQRRKRRTEEETKALCSNKYEEEIAGSLIEADDIGVSWDDIGGLASVKELLREISVYPMRYPELYTTKGPKGVLLFGPPGTGKTMLAKAVATESGANFISVDSTTIGSKWYGESEKYAKAVFTLARKLAPCVIFIDEIDSLLSSRDDSEKSTIASVKTTLMREWDGLGSANDRVMVMGATNRPFSLDEAILRRLPRRVMVDLPEEEERCAILRVGLEGRTLAADLDLAEFAKKLTQYSGSDIHELCREAILRSSHEKARALDAQGIHHVPALTSVRAITKEDLELALAKIRPSVAADSAVMAKVREWDESYGESGRKNGTQKPLMSMYS